MIDLALAGQPADKGAALLRLLRGHRLEGFEKSFKMAPGTLLAERYLLGIHKADISPAELFAICVRLGMPEEYLANLRGQAEPANAFHFGFEGSGRGGIYKVYLEFAGRLAPDATPTLLHLAYKWDALDPAVGTIARYECHPGLSTQAILERLSAHYPRQEARAALAAVRGIVALAAGRTREPLMYLEVGEENNPRASFDIKLHDAGLQVQEIAPWLAQLREHFAIPAAQLAPLLEPIGEATLGHLSGGMNREGRDFVTVYYAADAA